MPDKLTRNIVFKCFESHDIGKVDKINRNALDDHIMKNKLLDLYTKLSKLKKSKFAVQYSRNVFEGREYGRCFATNPLSLQYFKRDIRNYLCTDAYIDVDMVNSNYNILENLAMKHHIPCDVLTSYNNSREHTIQEFCTLFDTNRDAIKKLFALILNGGSVTKWFTEHNIIKQDNQQLFRIQNEVHRIRDDLLKLDEYQFYVRLSKQDPTKVQVGCAISNLLFDIEYTILMNIVNFAQSKYHIKPGVLMHDGCIFYQNKHFDTNVLRDLESHVKQELGYTIGLVIKPFDYDPSITDNSIVNYQAYDDLGDSVSQVASSSATIAGDVMNVFLHYAKLHRLVKDRTTVYQVHDLYLYHATPLYSGEYLFILLLENFQTWCRSNGFEEIAGLFIAKAPYLVHHFQKFFEYVNDPRFPSITFDKHLVGFKNGVWNIKNLTFVSLKDCEEIGFVRKFFEFEFEDKIHETPLWNSVIRHQNDDEHLEFVFHALLGRLFFNVNELDHFEIFLAIQGPAGIGKSTIMDTLSGMFRAGVVSTIDDNTSSSFALEGKDKSECIIIQDAKENLASKLELQTLQKMVTGEYVEINSKGIKCKTVLWETPLVMAFNRDLGYKDDSGSLVRRFACIPWTRVVTEQDPTLKKRIIKQESPLIFINIIKRYHELLNRYQHKPFWSFAPETMKCKRFETKLQTNYLESFLNEGPDTNQFYVIHKEGTYTGLEDFKAVFRIYLKSKDISTYRWSNECDNVTLELHGFSIARPNLCKSCNLPGGKGCCSEFSINNRYKKYVIQHMNLINRCDT